jgi:hypothetical protein
MTTNNPDDLIKRSDVIAEIEAWQFAYNLGRRVALLKKEINNIPAARSDKGEAVAYKAGNWYETKSGKLVRALSSDDCMECSDGIYRYNRKGDRGRVTGSPHDFSHPENFIQLFAAPQQAIPAEPNKFHVEVCRAMALMNQSIGVVSDAEGLEAKNILRQALWDYKEPAAPTAPIDNVHALESHYDEGVSAALCAGRIDGKYRGEPMSDQDIRSYHAMRDSMQKHKLAIRALITGTQL